MGLLWGLRIEENSECAMQNMSLLFPTLKEINLCESMNLKTGDDVKI